MNEDVFGRFVRSVVVLAAYMALLYYIIMSISGVVAWARNPLGVGIFLVLSAFLRFSLYDRDAKDGD